MQRSKFWCIVVIIPAELFMQKRTKLLLMLGEIKAPKVKKFKSLHGEEKFDRDLLILIDGKKAGLLPKMVRRTKKSQI